MSQTQVVSTTIAAELIQSFGFEITIFVVSVALALTFRGATVGKQIGGCQKELAAPNPKPSRAGRKKETTNVTEQATARTNPQVDAVTQKIDYMINCANKRQPGRAVVNKRQCEDAIATYQEMRANGEHRAIKDHKGRGRNWSPQDVFASLVQCATHIGRPEVIELLFDDMIAVGIERSLGFYEATMKMLAAMKCYKEALAVCSRLEADGLEPSPVTLSCLIGFAFENGESDRAICFFNRLAACSMPSIRAYMTILRVYSRLQDWPNSLALIRDMQSREAPIDSLVLNIVLSTGITAGELGATQTLLKEFAKIGLPDTVSYNTVMKGLAQRKDIGGALALLDEMCKRGVKPNSITFNTAIDAAVRGGQVADAWSVLAQMLEAGLAPDKFTCTTLVKGLQNGATSKQLTVILDLLRSVTVDCNSSVCSFLFRSVIEAAAKVEDPALTARAVSQMREQRVMLPPQEYQRLLRVLMQEV